MPLELTQAMFIGMDPPKHDRLKALFQRGFTPKRIADHEDEIREITVGVLDRLEGRETCDLVTDVAQPVVSRVIGSFMGIPPEDDAIWARLMNTTLGAGDPDLNPEGVQAVMERDVPEIFERCQRLIAERREHPTDDLTSVLVHAEVDGERLEEHEIVMGFFLLMAAGNDSTKATYCSGMRALIENPEERQKLLDDPSLIPSAVEESLRMFPAFAHFRRTATRDTELHGQKIREGEKVVMWYVSSNRDETRYEDPDRFDVTRNPEHQAFGAGGRHFCLGTALARLELRILLEETLARFPAMELAGTPLYAESPFINQLKTLPVRLRAGGSLGGPARGSSRAAPRLQVERVRPGERLGHGRVQVLRDLAVEVEAGQRLGQRGVLADRDARLARGGHDPVGDQALAGRHHLRGARCPRTSVRMRGAASQA